MAVAIPCAVVVCEVTFLVSFQKRSVTTSNAVLPLLDATSEQRMLILTYTNVWVAEKNLAPWHAFESWYVCERNKCNVLLRCKRRRPLVANGNVGEDNNTFFDLPDVQRLARDALYKQNVVVWTFWQLQRVLNLRYVAKVYLCSVRTVCVSPDL